MGNSVEDAAIFWLRFRLPGAKDTRHVPEAVGDLEWDGRIIEVKAYSRSARGQTVWLEPRQHQAALEDPRFELWLVENISAGADAIEVTVLRGTELKRLAHSGSPRSFIEMPLPVADYDEAHVSRDSVNWATPSLPPRM